MEMDVCGGRGDGRVFVCGSRGLGGGGLGGGVEGSVSCELSLPLTGGRDLRLSYMTYDLLP